MRPTRVGTLLATLVVLGLATWLVVSQSYGSLPPLPGRGVASLAVVVAFVVVVTVSTHNRLTRRGMRPITPLTVARIAVLAKAASLVGAAVAGIYAGFLGYVAPKAGTVQDARSDAVTAGLGVLVALLLSAAGLVLERVCRAPDPPDDDRDSRRDTPRDLHRDR